MKAATRARLVAALFGCALAFGVLEAGLRLAPRAISPYLLILFEPGLRTAIAGDAFMVRQDFVPLERDDLGPPLMVRKPATRIVSVDERASDNHLTDELGFCNADGVYRDLEQIALIAVGDSFTWCHAVKANEAWVPKLGERLHVPAYNLGRGGSGPYEYLQVLRRYGLAKRPRVVLLNMYEGNDLRDAAYYWDYRRALEQTGKPPRDGPEPILPAVTQSLIGRHSYAANFVLAFAARVRDHHMNDDGESGIDFRYSLLLAGEEVPFNVENRDTDEVAFARRLREGRISLEIWDEALKAFAELGRTHGFDPVVAYTPSAHTSYGKRVRFADDELAPLLAELSTRQRKFLAERAATLGIGFADLTPALVAAAAQSNASSLLYDPISIHLTPAGHDVIAASLAQFLIERGFTPNS